MNHSCSAWPHEYDHPEKDIELHPVPISVPQSNYFLHHLPIAVLRHPNNLGQFAPVLAHCQGVQLLRKDAPFEEVNFDLYKPGAKGIAFTMSKARTVDGFAAS